MNVEQIVGLLEGKPITEVMRLCAVARDPVRMVVEGLDFTNVRVETIPGAVRFGVWESSDAKHDPKKFAVGYVTYVNGPMSPKYTFTESDFQALEKSYPPEAVAGLRNQKLILAPQPVGEG